VALVAGQQPGGTQPIKENIRVNNEIRAREVRLIDHNNQQVGVVQIADALRMAQEAELDLVEVAAEAKPPVCKIVDYKKVIYEQKRRARDSRKRQKTVDIKEVKMRPSIDKHDYQTKINHAREFLTGGNKVKVTFIYKGREQVHQSRATKLMEQILADLDDVASMENVARMGPKLTALILGKKR
jgi:translation initiation factor IF-3